MSMTREDSTVLHAKPTRAVCDICRSPARELVHVEQIAGFCCEECQRKLEAQPEEFEFFGRKI